MSTVARFTNLGELQIVTGEIVENHPEASPYKLLPYAVTNLVIDTDTLIDHGFDVFGTQTNNSSFMNGVYHVLFTKTQTGDVRLHTPVANIDKTQAYTFCTEVKVIQNAGGFEIYLKGGAISTTQESGQELLISAYNGSAWSINSAPSGWTVTATQLSDGYWRVYTTVPANWFAGTGTDIKLCLYGNWGDTTGTYEAYWRRPQIEAGSQRSPWTVGTTPANTVLLGGEIEESMPVTTASIAPVGTTNLVPNPSASADLTGITKQGASSSNYSILRSTSLPSGLNIPTGVSVNVTATGDNNVTWTENANGENLSGLIPVSASTTYTFSCWVYSANGLGFGIRPIEWTSSGGVAKDDSESNLYTNTGGWQRIQRTITTTSTTAFVSFRVYVGFTTGSGYITGAQIEQGSQLTNFVVRTRPNNSLQLEGTAFENAANALVFDGSTGYVQAPDSTSLHVTGSQTIEILMIPTNVSGNRQNPYNKAYGGEGTITQEVNGSFSYYYGTSGTDGGTYQSFGSATGINVNNQLIHIAVVRDLSAMTLTWYVNGQVSTTNTANYSAAVASTDPLKVGAGYAGFWQGTMYYCREWNVARTQAQIQDNMHTKLTGAESGLVALYQFDETGMLALDKSPNHNNGTINGGVTRTFV